MTPAGQVILGTNPKITVTDGTYAAGSSGVRVSNAAAPFDNLAITNR